MKTAILFDLDGTLLDTLEDLTAAVNYALDRGGYPRCTKDQVRRFVGNGAAMLIHRALPAGADREAVLADFRAYYDAHCLDRTGPYGGVLPALAELAREHPLAVLSNKPDTAVKQLCRRFFPGVYAQGETPDCPRKPAPDMLFKALAAVGAQRWIYVGDSEVDIATAKNAGGPCLSVLWGFRDRPELEAAGAFRFCAAPQALPEAIKEMEKALWPMNSLP